MKKKQLVVIGYGGIGRKWHARHALTSDVVELHGVYDIDPAKQELARENGVFVYDSLEAVLADPAVDLVTVATPNDVHKPIVLAALEAGKAVICEKPVAMNSAELREMIVTSEHTGSLFTVHQNRRWDSDYLTMKALYDSGKLGRVFGIESRVQGSRGIPGDWRKEAAHGGGMMLDWGVHLIDQALQMVKSDITRIYATFDYLTGAEVEDGFKMDLFFANGVTYRVEVGTNHFLGLPRWYMTGTEGSARLNDWHDPAEVARCTAWQEDGITPVQTGGGLTKTMAPRDGKTLITEQLPQPESDAHDFYRNVCRAMDGTEAQLVTHAEVLRVFRVMEAAMESARIGAPVAFTERL